MKTCSHCGGTAPAHFVACPSCQTLFHADQLTQLSKAADAAEAQGDFVSALGHLRAMEPLLPPASRQAEAVRARLTALEPRAGSVTPSKMPKWLAGLGAVGVALWKFLGPLMVVLSKSQLLFAGLLKLPTLLSFFVSAALWRDGPGGTGLALVVLGSIYVHEMGHTWAFHRYGIAVSTPMFVPGFGAFVRGAHYPKSLSAVGDVALSGPVWGGVAGLITLLAGVVFDQAWLSGAAVLIAEINLFNLIPVWQLDGGRASKCLSGTQLVVLGVLAAVGGALAASPMAVVSGLGLAARRFVTQPQPQGDRRTFLVFLGLFGGLLALRLIAQFLTTRGLPTV